MTNTQDFLTSGGVTRPDLCAGHGFPRREDPVRPGAASVPDLITLVPERLLKRSGKIFYSARHAFESPARPLYILGLNPGGRPGAHAYETIAANIDQTLHREQDDWSAYVHESWSG